VAAWSKALQQVPWSKGEPARGERFLLERGCIACHSGPASLGPLLAEVAARSAPESLLLSVVFPNREIAATHQPTQFWTRDRQLHNGLVLYESAEVVILQTGAVRTERLHVADIVWRRPSDVSIMPTGLLRGLTTGDLADLGAALKALSTTP
jgi:putative heme-binding domain-containing protein